MSSDNIKKTCIEMVTQRGYTIDDIKDDIIICTKQNGKKLWIFLNIIQKFNVNKYQEYITVSYKNNIKHIIIIANKITPNIRKIVKNNTNLDVKIETFYEDEMKYNITKHILVPEHILVPHSESSDLKEKYGASNFPYILKNDPVCRFYNFPSDSIIKIIRKNGDIVYRIVK
jgi:DNA-directed RNA polymerase subunit H (RpoH/RPB5)